MELNVKHNLKPFGGKQEIISFRERVLRLDTNSMIHKKKKVGLYTNFKNNNLFVKFPAKRMKRQQENIFKPYILDANRLLKFNFLKLVRKWTKDRKRHFSHSDAKVGNKYVKKSSTPLTIIKVQINTMRYHQHSFTLKIIIFY